MGWQRREDVATKVKEVVAKERVFVGKGETLMWRFSKFKKEVADL
jgi:hypothetical protein